MLGMQRTMACSPSQRSRLAQGMPAAMETISTPAGSAGARARQTSFITCGLTASTTMSAPAAAAALSSKTAMPCSPAMRWRCSACGSLAVMRSAGTLRAIRPPIRLVAMLPAPMKAMRG
ncbi:hypothetical protein D3C78_498650 [compost metagenome]